MGDDIITTYPAGGLEQEVIIGAPEASVAVCPPAEPMEEEEEADAFDFFTAEPIGSKARDLEREQEEAAAAAAAAAATSITAVAAVAESSSSSSSEVTTVTTATGAQEETTWIT